MSTVYFKNLDSLRFLAFLFVFISHLGSPFLFDPNHKFAFLNIIMHQGKPAVSFFFVLSGFLITYLLTKEKYETSKINLKAFYIKRIFRILPLYFLVCFFGFILAPLITGNHVNESIYQHIILGANFNQLDLLTSQLKNSTILAPLWSIAIEEQFYLFWPILIAIVKPKHFPILFTGILVLSYGFIFLNKNEWFILQLHTFSVLPEFMIGALLSFGVYHNFILLERFKLLPKYILFILYVFSILGILFCPPPYSYFILPYIFAFIIAEQIFCRNSLFKVSKLLGLDYLGKISYGSYMYHSIVFFFIKLFFESLHLFDGNSLTIKTIYFLVCLSLTILISHLSFSTFENYFFNLRRRILKQ